MWIDALREVGDLLANLVGALVGVLLAFKLDRRWQQDQETRLYAEQLNVVRYEFARLLALADHHAAQLGPQTYTGISFWAPALEAFLRNPTALEHLPHGLLVVLTAMWQFVSAVQNNLEVGHHAVLLGRVRTPEGIAFERLQFAELSRGLRSAQEMIDEELQRLNLGVIANERDRAMIERFNSARLRQDPRG
jgi:hypothetical protein